MNLGKNYKKILLIIVRDLFVASFLLLAIFSFLEIIKPKIILNYLNFNIYFFIVLILGVITIFYFEPEQKEVKKLKALDYSAIILFSFLIGVFCFYLTRLIGWPSILVGVAGAVICYYFIILNFES